jgi:hypothetical protein
MPERLVFCGEAQGPNDSTAMRLALTGTRQNASLKLEDVGRMMVANVPDLLVDLVEIATYVYCADQATSRGGDAQRGMGADWRRDFRFIIPVRNPDHWGSREVLEQLRSTLSFLFPIIYSSVPISHSKPTK